MLSFDKGERKIAIIKGGKYNKKILRLSDNDKKVKFEDSDSDSGEEGDEYIESDYPVELVGDDFYKKNMKKRFDRDMKFNQIEQIRKAILKKNPKGLSDEQKKIYKLAITHIVETCKKEVDLDDGILIPLPQKIGNQIEHIYIAGPTGSGKTTWVGEYVKEYKRLFPEQPIWVFSRLNEDVILDKYNVKRIILDKGLIEGEPINASEFLEGNKGALVIFDDIDTIPDQKINKEVHRIRDDLLEVGRHDNVSVLSTGHQLMDYKRTRNLLNEASAVTFFPKSGSQYHITRFLKVYCGIPTEGIKKILALPSRWVTIYKTYPMYVLHQRGAFLL